MKDYIAVIGFAILLYLIDFNKEVAKGLITGILIGGYAMRRFKK